MRRRVTYLLVWLVATGSTIGVSYWGIRSVLVTASPEGSEPLSAADLRQAAPSPSASPSVSESPSPSPSPSLSPTQTPGWERNGPVSTRVFAVQGGQATFSCAKGDVHVTGFTAAKGFAESENRFAPDSLRVSFTADRHISRVWVTWRNGCYAEVSESV